MRRSKTPIFVLGFLIGMLPWTGSYAQHPIGVFDNHTVIGNPKLSGSATYDEATQTYSISGAGVDIWFNGDQFQYVYKKIKGDFILTANFAFIGPTGNGHRKIGWMVRESLNSAASHITSERTSRNTRRSGIIRARAFVYGKSVPGELQTFQPE